MATFQRPDTYVQEIDQSEGPITPPALGFGGMLAVTEKGPVGRPVRSASFPDWSRVFGDRETRGDAAYEAKAFFDEGGVELITTRMAHYTDIDDPDSFVGGVAFSDASTASVDATAASKLSAVPGPYNMEPGFDVDLDVDNAGVATATFTATPATAAGGGLAIVDLTGLTLILEMNDDGDVQTIIFTGAEVTAFDVAATINGQLQGGSAVENAGEVDIVSDLEGTDSEINITGGTALAEIGHTVGVDSGGGNVGNIDVVTSLEVKTVVELAVAGVTLTVNPDQTLRWTSDSLGLASELDFQSGSALAVLGLLVEVINGTAAGATQLTLKLEAGFRGEQSPGVAGNDLQRKITRNPLHASQGVGNDIEANILALDTSFEVPSLQGIAEKSVLRIVQGLITEYVEVLQVRTVVTGGNVQFFVDIVGAFVNPFTALLATMESTEFDIEVYEDNVLVETWEGLSMLDTADNYVETILNDDAIGSQYVVATDLDALIGLGADQPATDAVRVDFAGGSDETFGLVDADWVGSEIGGTGLRSLDSVREFMPFTTVGNNSAGVVHSAAIYARQRLYFEYVQAVNLGLSSEAAIAYREVTLGIDSSYASLYAGGIKVFDPIGVGKNPRRSIKGVGALMGLRARVDSLPAPDGGPWQSPAGEGDYGRLQSALDVVDDYNDTDHGRMNVVGINTIRKFGKTAPVLVWGARTLQTSKKTFRYINTRRQFQYFEKAIADGTRWAVFRNNDFRLWSRLVDSAVEFLRLKHKERAFPGKTEKDSFFVKVGVDQGTMTQANIDDGEVIGEVGMAPHKPGEFIIWRFSQFEGGATIEEL